jgi:flagellar biosynthesis protein FlhG
VSRGNLVAVVSGKGGVGKTNVAANLAVAVARRGRRALLVDGDLGLANADVLLGLIPRGTLADVLDERATIEEVRVRGPRGIDVLPAASGRSELAALGPRDAARLAAAVAEYAADYDVAIVDAASGIGPLVVAFAAVSARRLLVATPEPTCLADAYALVKVLAIEAGVRRIDLVVNAARHAREARAAHERLARMAARFLPIEPAYAGWLPRDARLADSVQLQRAVVDAFPASAVARSLNVLAETLIAATPALAERGSAAGARA